MLNFLDDSYYLGLRPEVMFHYFGNGVLADYLSQTVGFFSDIELEIIKQIGRQSLTYAELKCCYADTSATAEMAIGKLYQKGVLVFSREPFDSTLHISGKLGKYYPKELAIELTNTCNYYCPFCYKNASVKGHFISSENIAKIADIARGNIKRIMLTGGEPTLHPDFANIADTFTEFAEVSMVSNGSIFYSMNPSVLTKLSIVQFSIYGRNNNEYKQMTGCADGFDRLSKSIRRAQELNIPVSASITLCEQTIDSVEELVQIAADFHISDLIVGLADSFGRGIYLQEHPIATEKKMDDALTLICRLKHQYRRKMLIHLPNISTKHIGSHEDVSDHVYRCTMDCGCGSEYLVVSQDGKLRPCQLLSEETFSYKSAHALEEHINGDFHVRELSENTRKYYEANKLKWGKTDPCTGLNSVYTRESL